MLNPAEAEHLLDILERVNRDPDLVAMIRKRADLEYPDLDCALRYAQRAVRGA